MSMALPKQEGKKICFNWFVAMPLPKLRARKCGNEFVAMALPKQDKKKKKNCCKWFVAMPLRKQMRDIKKIYAYSYSFNIFFFTETVWFVMFFYGKNTLRTNNDRFKYIDSYSKVHAVNKNKKKYTDSKHIRIDSSILVLILKCTQ